MWDLEPGCSGGSDLVPQLSDGVLQGQDLVEERALQSGPQAGQVLAVGPFLPLDQFGLQTLQSSQDLLALCGGH